MDIGGDVQGIVEHCILFIFVQIYLSSIQSWHCSNVYYYVFMEYELQQSRDYGWFSS
jgi:hypothetical protein